MTCDALSGPHGAPAIGSSRIKDVLLTWSWPGKNAPTLTLSWSASVNPRGSNRDDRSDRDGERGEIGNAVTKRRNA